MTVFVTGGSGFLGSHLLQHLSTLGMQVRSLQRSALRDPPQGVTSIEGSILDSGTLRKAMAGAEAIFHLAGWVSRDKRDAEAMRALHVDGTRNVMEAAARNGIKRIIYASTSGTIACSASAEDVATEATPFPEKHIGKWPYYATKLEAEKVAFQQASKLGLQLTSVHPSLLLGPGDLRISSTEDIIRILKKQVPAIPSGGLNFVDVRDVAAATATALKKGAPGERYLLGNVNWTLKEFIHRVGKEGGVKVPRLPAPDLLTRWSAYLSEPIFRALKKTPPLDGVSAEMSQVFWYFDSSKAQSELGFRPRDPDETLRDTIDDLHARGLAP